MPWINFLTWCSPIFHLLLVFWHNQKIIAKTNVKFFFYVFFKPVVSGFTFKFLIHYKFIFVDKMGIQVHSFAYNYSIFPHHYWKDCNVLCAFMALIIYLTRNSWVYFWDLYVFVYMPLLYCLDSLPIFWSGCNIFVVTDSSTILDTHSLPTIRFANIFSY